jgi:hypothetical protein
VNADHRFHFDDAGSDLDEVEAERVDWATRHVERLGMDTRRPHIRHQAIKSMPLARRQSRTSGRQ